MKHLINHQCCLISCEKKRSPSWPCFSAPKQVLSVEQAPLDLFLWTAIKELITTKVHCKVIKTQLGVMLDLKLMKH